MNDHKHHYNIIYYGGRMDQPIVNLGRLEEMVDQFLAAHPEFQATGGPVQIPGGGWAQAIRRR